MVHTTPACVHHALCLLGCSLQGHVCVCVCDGTYHTHLLHRALCLLGCSLQGQVRVTVRGMWTDEGRLLEILHQVRVCVLDTWGICCTHTHTHTHTHKHTHTHTHTHKTCSHTYAHTHTHTHIHTHQHAQTHTHCIWSESTTLSEPCLPSHSVSRACASPAYLTLLVYE